MAEPDEVQPALPSDASQPRPSRVPPDREEEEQGRFSSSGKPAGAEQQLDDEVYAQRQVAAKTATLCADCFTPLAPMSSVTTVIREVRWVPAYRHPFGTYIKEHNERERVPICLLCSLMLRPAWWASNAIGRGRRHREHSVLDESFYRVHRIRCDACQRPMRVRIRDRLVQHIPRNARACCLDCGLTARLRRDRERHRVHHKTIECVVCGAEFVQKRSDATTCSNRCRQRLFRQRRRDAETDLIGEATVSSRT